jgi:hypothetical protein
MRPRVRFNCKKKSWYKDHHIQAGEMLYNCPNKLYHSHVYDRKTLRSADLKFSISS